MVEQSFHEAIRSGDRMARLVYADWLEENGRVQESALLRSGRWRLVPAGSFWMGGGGGKAGDKQVEIPQPFYLGAFPVTQGEWKAVMGNNPSWFSGSGKGWSQVRSVSADDLKLFPVERVSRREIKFFLQKLNGPRKPGDLLYRLPTEAEWEYACRAAARSKEECSYHFYFKQPTNDLSANLANFNGGYPTGNGSQGEWLQRTTKVGSYQPNRLGIYDMHGNVWEWCDDLWGNERVIRGGSWDLHGERCQAACRRSSATSIRNRNLGLRLVQVPVRS